MVMPRFIASLLTRREESVDQLSNLKAAVGAILGMIVVGQLALMTGLPLLIAPLGSTSVMLFARPSSEMAQPINIMAGYLVAIAIYIAASYAFPGWWVAAAFSVGLTIFVMRGLRVTHPPAGAIPILGFDGGVPGPDLFIVVFIGCVTLIVLAFLVHRVPPRRDYPLRDGGPNGDTKP